MREMMGKNRKGLAKTKKLEEKSLIYRNRLFLQLKYSRASDKFGA